MGFILQTEIRFLGMAKQTTPRSMTQEELKTLYKVSMDPYYFATFIWVINPVLGRVQFNLYGYQKSVLYQFLKERFNIILKFRQAGLTELISMYCLWLCMYHPNKKVNIISIKDTIAKKVLKKIKFMYKNLPWYLQTPIINGRAGEFGSVTSMEFCNGSLIESIPTSEQAGRSESLSLLVIDEAAAVRWANQIWAAAFPTLSTGGSAIINSCITGDTEIIGKNGNFRVEQVCPKEFGVQDIRFMNLHVLTHKLQWKKVLYGVNKGILETWELTDSEGDTIKCTPAHKFLTPKGWMPAEKVISKGLPVIKYASGLEKLEEPPITIPPTQEILKEIPGFPNYLVSNLGYIKHKDTGEIKEGSKHSGYYRVKLWSNGTNKTFTVSKLVAETFIGQIPEGYVVDHIDCNKEHNYVTNLQIIPVQENTRRAAKYSRGLVLNTNTGKGASDLQLVGYIKWLYSKGMNFSRIQRRVLKKFKKSVTTEYIKRIVVKKTRNLNVSLAYLEVIRKYSDNIYDITVEGDESYITTSNHVSHNTPLGVGNWYHSMWVDAISGANGVNPIRLHWDMHPDRDDQWYQDMAKALGPKRTAQEIDGDFLSSGNTVFDLTDIKGIEEDLYDYPVLKTRFNGAYKEFCEVDPNKEYFIGADCATGRATDYSSFTVMDAAGEENAIYKGRIPLDKYAILLGNTGEKFNYAKIAPETNDIGAAVTIALQTEGYPNLYYSQKLLKKKGKSRPEVELIPGWLTTTKNRSVIIEGLEKDIREGNIIVKDPFFVQEAYTFIYDGSNRPVAMGKHKRASSVDIDLEGETYSDDDIFGKAITNHIRKQINNNVGVLPQ